MSISDWTTERQVWNGIFELECPTPAENGLYELLKDGSTTDMSVKGDVTPVVYKFTVPDDQIMFLSRCNIIIQDGGISITKFGGIGALANGLTVKAIDADGTTVLKDYTKDITIKKNNHFHLLAGVDVPIISAAGDDAMNVRWTIRKKGSPILFLAGQSFQVTVQDDLTDLTEMFWMLQGDIFDDGVFNDA